VLLYHLVVVSSWFWRKNIFLTFFFSKISSVVIYFCPKNTNLSHNRAKKCEMYSRLRWETAFEHSTHKGQCQNLLVKGSWWRIVNILGQKPIWSTATHRLKLKLSGARVVLNTCVKTGGLKNEKSRYKLRKIRSEGKNWWVHVFFSVINDFQDENIFFDFSEKFGRFWSIFDHFHENFGVCTKFLGKIEKNIFVLKIINITEKHVYSLIFSSWTYFAKFVRLFLTSKSTKFMYMYCVSRF